jgi:hypothetical protein
MGGLQIPNAISFKPGNKLTLPGHMTFTVGDLPLGLR